MMKILKIYKLIFMTYLTIYKVFNIPIDLPSLLVLREKYEFTTIYDLSFFTSLTINI